MNIDTVAKEFNLQIIKENIQRGVRKVYAPYWNKNNFKWHMMN